MTLWQDRQPQTRREAREMERAAALRESQRRQQPEPEDSSEGQAREEAPSASPAQARAEDRREQAAPVPAVVGQHQSRAGEPESGPRVASHFASAPFGSSSRPQLPNYEASFDALLAQTPATEEVDELDGVDDPAQKTEHASGTEALSALFDPVTARDGETPRREPSGAGSETSETESRQNASPQGELYRDSASTGEVEPVTTPVSLVGQPSGVPGPDEPHGLSGPSPDAGSASERPAGDVSRPAEGASTPQEGARLAAGDPAVPASPRTLTRRELRAVLQAEQARRDAEHGGTPVAPTPEVVSTPVAASHPSAVPGVEPDSDELENAGPAPSAAVFTVDESGDARQGPVAAPDVATENPVSHWTRGGQTDRQNEAFDQIISRGVGPSGGATTTSALILPTVPTAPPATGPIAATGEILVTGSIDLPRGLGSTGQHPDRYDTSEMDRIFDQPEEEVNAVDAEPIRASHAVSGHTSTRGVITPPKKDRGRLPLILSITAGVLLVAVVGLLVAGYVLKVF